jgi:plasmid maintenance system antidote protein VapI
MTKDRRYKTVNNLISGGYIKTFREILETIPKTTIAKDLGMHHQTFTKLVDHPDRFSFKDAFRIAALIGVEEMAILNLIYNQCTEDRKTKKKK